MQAWVKLFHVRPDLVQLWQCAKLGKKGRRVPNLLTARRESSVTRHATLVWSLDSYVSHKIRGCIRMFEPKESHW